jgi:hypothetical protein
MAMPGLTFQAFIDAQAVPPGQQFFTAVTPQGFPRFPVVAFILNT